MPLILGKQITINIKNKPLLSIPSNSLFTIETGCFDNKTSKYLKYRQSSVNPHTFKDLDSEAISLAREKFKEKMIGKPFFDDIDRWSDETFLDKARITLNGIYFFSDKIFQNLFIR